MSILLRREGKWGNGLEFATYENLGPTCIVVHDKDCQLSRVYKIGKVQELIQGEDLVIIESFEQVITAWVEGKVWF